MRALLLALALLAPLLALGAPCLMGMNIGAKNYDDPAYQRQLAKLDIVILGFYREWKGGPAAMREVVRQLKALNPRLRVGQYTILNEAYDDPRDAASGDLRQKLEASRWWLRSAGGRKVQWTPDYGTWEVNFTAWAPPDAEGKRWPQWLAERNHAAFFRDVPELDIVYLDNVMSPPRVRGDWDGDGADDDPRSPRMLAAHRAAHRAHWQRLRELAPRLQLVGNADNDLGAPEWRGQLDGAFLEGLIGERWSIETRQGWEAMMQHYRAVLRNVRARGLVGFGAQGDASDRRLFRYAYASSLLEDGCFSFTDARKPHSSVPWFEEYDLKLGRARSGPPTAAWRDGVWRRDFEHGVVLVNPTARARQVELGDGLRRVTLRPRDGIVLRR